MRCPMWERLDTRSVGVYNKGYLNFLFLEVRVAHPSTTEACSCVPAFRLLPPYLPPTLWGFLVLL
jgi:hypothetical protein